MQAILMTVLLMVVPSNMEMAERALNDALEEIPGRLAAFDIEELVVEVTGEHAGNWFIQQTVASVLHASGFRVRDRGSSEETLVSLRVRPMELVVEYGRVRRPWIVGRRRVERIAKCELSCTLVGGDGGILMTMRAGGFERDEVSWSEAQLLEGSSGWDWLSSGLPEDRGGGILEPIIVSGVVASLVYLFYSSRAD